MSFDINGDIKAQFDEMKRELDRIWDEMMQRYEDRRKLRIALAKFRPKYGPEFRKVDLFMEEELGDGSPCMTCDQPCYHRQWRHVAWLIEDGKRTKPLRPFPDIVICPSCIDFPPASMFLRKPY